MREIRTYGSEGGAPGNRSFLPLSTSVESFNMTIPLYMIGHNYKGVQFNIRIMIGQLLPNQVDHSSSITQPHLPVCDFAKETFPPVRADSNKICSSRGIVVSFQTYRASQMFFRIVYHAQPSL